MKIGEIEIKRNKAPLLILSPMAGVTDLTFRGICRSYGADLTVTEMVSAKALRFNDKKTRELCRLAADEHPSAVQLFGSDPQTMAWAAAELLSGKNPPDIIDINMGCPMPKITKNGEGSALMRSPALAAEIVSEVVRMISPVPVTVKIRSGWNEHSKNAPEIAKAAEQSGASAITIHGRTREQLYAPPVDFKIISDVADAVSIPVIGNGGIDCASDAVEMIYNTGCSGLAIARGALGKPWIFEEIRTALEGRTYSEPALQMRIRAAVSHLQAVCADKGRRGIQKSRGAVAHYIKGIPGAAQARDLINRADSPSEIEDILFSLLQKT